MIVLKKLFFLCFTSLPFTGPRFTSPVQSAKYSMPSITTSIKQALIDAHFVPPGMFPGIVCKKKQ